MDLILVILDLLGTFVFALSGALVGVRHRLDLFGVLVLSFVAGNGGGVMRDAMIGATPPAALQDWRYVAISIVAGLFTFWRAGTIERWRNPVQSIDAVGLGVFAVAGALKAQAFGLGPVGAMLLGMLTGIGGGMIRDVLVAQVPTVLKAELYAIAALAGAGVLPWPRAVCEDVIRASGKGVQASLAGFAAAFDQARQPLAAARISDIWCRK